MPPLTVSSKLFSSHSIVKYVLHLNEHCRLLEKFIILKKIVTFQLAFEL
jgi:hypothetical protein